MIESTCSECGKRFEVADDKAGKRGKCRQCGAILLVPQLELVSIDAADASPATSARRVVHATRRVVPTSPAVSNPKRRKHRLWLALLLVAAVIAAPFAPRFSLWFGIVLLVLCVATFVTGVQALSRRLLRLNPAEKWGSGIRLTMYALIGLVLILAGSIGAEYKAEQTRIAAQQAAEEAEQRRLTNEANAQVVALVREAEAAWKHGDSPLAEKKLEAASSIPNATELGTIRRLHNRMANAKVDALVAEATKAVKVGDIDAGSKKVQAALAVPHADNLAEARRLDQQIRNATDPARIRSALMELHDEALLQLEENGAMPEQLLSGYEGLDGRTAALAKAQLAGVAVAREQRRQEQLDRERTAAETARKAEEERKAHEAAAEKAAAQHKARVPKQRATRLPGYEVVLDDSSDTPGKTQVYLRITLDRRPSESELRALLTSLYEKAKTRSGFKFRAHPNAVYIYAFGKKNYHKNSGTSWIGMLSCAVDDKEPTIRLDSSRLKAQFEESSTRFALTEKQRKRIYWKLFQIEDKAQRQAERKVPNPKTSEDFKRQAGEFNKLHARYLKRLLRQYKITDEQRVQIFGEGMQKNWPLPSP